MSSLRLFIIQVKGKGRQRKVDENIKGILLL